MDEVKGKYKKFYRVSLCHKDEISANMSVGIDDGFDNNLTLLFRDGSCLIDDAAWAEVISKSYASHFTVVAEDVFVPDDQPLEESLVIVSEDTKHDVAFDIMLLDFNKDLLSVGLWDSERDCNVNLSFTEGICRLYDDEGKATADFIVRDHSNMFEVRGPILLNDSDDLPDVDTPFADTSAREIVRELPESDFLEHDEDYPSNNADLLYKRIMKAKTMIEVVRLVVEDAPQDTDSVVLLDSLRALKTSVPALAGKTDASLQNSLRTVLAE